MAKIEEQIKLNEKTIKELREQLNEVYTLREALREALTNRLPASRRRMQQLKMQVIDLTIAVLYNSNSILTLLKSKPCTCSSKEIVKTKDKKENKDVMYN